MLGRGEGNSGKPERIMLGRRGEDAACEYLMALGHTIIERNCRKGHLELDIISLDSRGVHFVEVKSRVAPAAVAPEANVTVTKQKRLARAALAYLNSSKDSRLTGDAEVNFDVVTVVFDKGKTDIEFFPNAFYPIYL